MLPNAPRPDTWTCGAPGGAGAQAASQFVLPKIVVPDVVACVPSGTTTFVEPNSTPTCTVDSPGVTCTTRLPNTAAPWSAVATPGATIATTAMTTAPTTPFSPAGDRAGARARGCRRARPAPGPPSSGARRGPVRGAGRLGRQVGDERVELAAVPGGVGGLRALVVLDEGDHPGVVGRAEPVVDLAAFAVADAQLAALRLHAAILARGRCGREGDLTVRAGRRGTTRPRGRRSRRFGRAERRGRCRRAGSG